MAYMQRFKRLLYVLGLVSDLHFAWITLGLGAASGAVLTGIVYVFSSLPWWVYPPLFVGILLLVAGASGVAVRAVVKRRPSDDKMPRQMAVLHWEGLDRLDDLRGLRAYRIDDHTKRHYDSWFDDWDRRTGNYVAETEGPKYWGQFGGDTGWLATNMDDFPTWVRDMATAVDRRLARLRWIANGKQGLM